MFQRSVWKKFSHWESVERDPHPRRPATNKITWECWTCISCNQQSSVTGSARTRSWSGASKNYCVRDFDTGSWHETCCGKILSVASTTRAEGTSCCSWENCVTPPSAYFEGNWGVIVLCTMFLASCIFFNKSLYFSYYMAGYLLDRHQIHRKPQKKHPKKSNMNSKNLIRYLIKKRYHHYI